MTVFPWESWESPLALDAIREGRGEQHPCLYRMQLKINPHDWERLRRLAVQAPAGHVCGYRCISKKDINYCSIARFGRNKSRKKQVRTKS